VETGRKDGNLRLQVPQQQSDANNFPRRPLSTEAQSELQQLTEAYNVTVEHDAQHLCRVSHADVVSAVHIQAAAAPHTIRPRPRYKYLASFGGLLLGLALTLVFDPARWTTMTGTIGIVATLSAAIGAAFVGMAWAEDAKIARNTNRRKVR
jgi:hypothetical protein